MQKLISKINQGFLNIELKTLFIKVIGLKVI